RQVELRRESGVGSRELFPRETRMFDEKLGKTIKMRSKEDAADYRFISDPDLGVVKISEKMVREIRAGLPEMPSVKLDRLLKKYKVSAEDAGILTRNLELVEFFEGLVEGTKEIGTQMNADERGFSNDDVRRMLPWVTVELLRVLNYNKMSLEDADVDVKPEHLAELIVAVWKGEVTKLKGKQLMNDFVPRSFSLAEHAEEVSSIDEAGVENICRQVIADNVKVVDEYKGGKAASLNFLIGQVMRVSERRADFGKVTEVMKRLIGGEE
ncbi:MAG: hypothetical protein KJ592_04900, partial [Nanoarchaeota archaeon]|nr:hypothetical protein [Nanoarchaeota archaeon]